MDETIKLSIIVPVYNTARYLEKCIHSLLQQQLNEFELIIVNDGSTDNSLSIIQSFAAKDSRIQVIDKCNEGAGIARNMALQQAKGKYIGFVDSDDWIDQEMFQEMYQLASRDNADITVCAFRVFEQANEKMTLPDWAGIPLTNEFDLSTFNYDLIGDRLFNFTPGPFNKIYKKDFLEKINPRFAEGVIYEDVPFVFTCLLHADKINYTRKPLYNYRYLRSDSSSSGSDNRHLQIFEVLDLLKDKLIETGLYDKVKYGFQTFRFRHFQMHFLQIGKSFRNDFWRKIQQEYRALDLVTKKHVRKNILPFRIGLHLGIHMMLIYYKIESRLRH